MIGKRRVDLTIDPPPDLAIEVDVTSKTGLDAYQALGVRELWRFEEGQRRISCFQNGQYQDSATSPHFPDFPIIELVSQFLEHAQIEGRSQTLKGFRDKVQALIR